MTDAELMMELFRGSDLAHGRSELSQKVTDKGKQEARSWLEKRAVTLEDWEKHLAGKSGIGMPPLNSKNMVRWGAIDVDVYQGFSFPELAAKIATFNLPLVLCRSKSGGPHLYLFLTDWVPAKDMIEKLDGLAGALGFGTSEIFPKQATIGTDGKLPDFGSWINMPYFDAENTLRYGVDEKGNAILKVRDWIDYVKLRMLPPDKFRIYEPPVAPEVFKDGPPCLNSIIASKPTELRNIILSNAAVYLKKAYGENWAPKLDEVNNMFPSPLGSAEVEAIKRSYGKKDYRYQCSKQPLCNFCNASACKRTKFGIGTQDFLPSSRSLTVLLTEPPIWYLDLEMPNGKSVRMSLSTEQLQNPRLFQRRAMEVTQQMPPSLKMEQWEPIVQGLMAHCTRIDVPPELSPKGQLVEHLNEFLANRASEESMGDVVRGLAYRDATRFYFRLRDFQSYLRTQRFDQLKQNEIISILKHDLKAEKEFRLIEKRGVNLITLPLPPKEESIHDNHPLKPGEFNRPY